MATSLQRTVDRAMLARTGGLVGVCTAVLTASFVGVVALASGNADSVGSRLQFYILAGALAFVGSLLVLEESRHDGRTVIQGALVASGLGYWSVRNWRVVGRRLPDNRL